jgi:tetrahydromethanopterin S-methyltransferase subunit G
MGNSLSPFVVVILAGTICGVLDIISATVLFLSRGGTFERLLQFIASGALGESSFRGGKKTAALGLLFHFVIAFSAAAIYYATSRSFSPLIAQPVLCGILYGTLIHLFMTFITIPLSRAPKRKFSASFFFSQLAVHMFIVGLSISTAIARLSGTSPWSN